jgi:hypothetical protein
MPFHYKAKPQKWILNYSLKKAKLDFSQKTESL